MDDELEHRYIKSDGNLEPYFTLRGHTGPLLSVTGPGQSRKSYKNSNLLFTAGDEGCIRVWDVPTISTLYVISDSSLLSISSTCSLSFTSDPALFGRLRPIASSIFNISFDLFSFPNLILSYVSVNKFSSSI